MLRQPISYGQEARGGRYLLRCHSSLRLPIQPQPVVRAQGRVVAFHQFRFCTPSPPCQQFIGLHNLKYQVHAASLISNINGSHLNSSQNGDGVERGWRHHRRLRPRQQRSRSDEQRDARLRAVQHCAAGEPRLRQVVHPHRQRIRHALRPHRGHVLQLRLRQVSLPFSLIAWIYHTYLMEVPLMCMKAFESGGI